MGLMVKISYPIIFMAINHSATMLRSLLSMGNHDLVRNLRVHKSFAFAPWFMDCIEGNRVFMSGHIIGIGKFYRANVIRLLQ